MEEIDDKKLRNFIKEFTTSGRIEGVPHSLEKTKKYTYKELILKTGSSQSFGGNYIAFLQEDKESLSNDIYPCIQKIDEEKIIKVGPHLIEDLVWEQKIAITDTDTIFNAINSVIKNFLEGKYIHEEVEPENDQNSLQIEVPFDPNQIKIKTQPYTVGQIIDRLEHEEIKLDTEFQRLPNLWKEKQQSRFIESLLLNLPIPAFYFDGQNDNLWEVVDGLQRISALKNFALDKTLTLQNLEFLSDYNGKKFDELPRELERRIKTFPITIYVIEKGTPSNVKYNLFSRINQGGLVLTPQEIRHAIHQGKPADLIRDLASKDTKYGKAFIKATEGKIKIERMEDRDFITRFVSFYLIPYDQYEPDLDTFMNKGMETIKSKSDEEISRLKYDFLNAMELAYKIFENDAFRKRFKEDDSRYPINKAIFESLSVAFSKLSDNERKKLLGSKVGFRKKFIALHNEKDGKFLNAITHSTASKESVITRFSKIEKIIKETLK